jgi:putative acetyltransferase
MSSADSYVLREATNADFEPIWSLIAKVLADYRIVADLDTTDSDLRDIEGHYARRGGAFFVLTDGDEIIGTVALARLGDSTVELCRMYLSPDYRRQGLGRRMMNEAMKEAERRGFSEVHLETASVLVEAIALYRSVGFMPVDQAPAGKNCDVVMSKRLGSA